MIALTAVGIFLENPLHFSDKLTDYNKSLLVDYKNLHLLVICANLDFSDENDSSRSKRSKDGGGNSRNCGGNT